MVLHIKSKGDLHILPLYQNKAHVLLQELQQDCFWHLPFLKIIQQKEDLFPLESLHSVFKTHKHILFLGTGGSSLGGQTLYSLYKKEQGPNLYFLDNVDSHTFLTLLKKLPLEETGYVVISKSGETLETIAQLLALLSFSSSFLQRGVVITDPQPSTLRTWAEEYKLKILDHPPYLGGRYSILSIVGMLPALLQGCSLKEFREGAISWVNSLKKDPFNPHSPFKGALWHLFYESEGYKNTVFMPYSDALRPLSLWYAQLTGESLGKKGRGFTPISSLGTVDQHSQLQLYLEGPLDKIITLITHERPMDLAFDPLWIPSSFSYLKGKSLNSVMDAEAQATFDVIQDQNIPSRHIHLNDLSEKTMGAFFIHFMLETYFIARFLNINPFDQPAVEASKKRTREILHENS